MDILGYLFFLPLGLFLFFNVIYLFIFALAGHFTGSDDISPANPPTRYRRIAILIPAYKEDKVIIDSVQANLSLDYPRQSFDLFVIADSFQPVTLQKLADYPIKIVEVSFEQSTVQKSISYALAQIPDHAYDIILISDADNHMAPDFLSRINLAFDKGWRAVQGHRVAKNTNTSVAVLDAMNEEVNNHIFRAGQRAMGLSASLIGSGMAFEPIPMKSAMSRIHTVGGYDKELEMNLMVDGLVIAYLKDAFIYDEKVQNLDVFERQRTRWIAAQIQFVSVFFRTGIRQFLRGNFHAANGLLKALVLPRTLLLAVLTVGFLLTLFLANVQFQQAYGFMLGILVISLLMSVPGYLWRKLSLRDLATFPLVVFRMVRSLLKFNTARKKFLHTPHGESTPQQNN
ncbi:glycosyltransferase family 2 protein [Nibrella viscosa]|uniref:Glycosyltransferase family 2 protein n=1 Tax=Nibrella viscosa TaxID=1084524 RepID=A0ABP8KKX7_9BACT